ncbi:hypothetical protein RHMOL_Rhmol11G0177000 [Rhododendron molle]|uniref:Uncharacterized protein n=1 Tax=Rhododendron molle TaxID=49168 RepID=A0ACC0LV36_RHOML|nr:hypothetical protein RHMOL_Rhmol11G0177000 [Rhododendron molle]
MAAPRTHEASTSTSRHAYQVFLSFRGNDLRKTFIDHLHTSLTQARIHTFKDDDEIQTGLDIESELEKAIAQSKISLVVFSKGYASSAWCLDELVKIAERRRVCGQVVLPVFYDVDPSHVRKQRGAFSQAFGGHDEEAETDERKERVKRWREALTEVANFGGKVLENEADGDFMSLGYSAHLSLGMRYPTGSAIGLKGNFISFNVPSEPNLKMRGFRSTYDGGEEVDDESEDYFDGDTYDDVDEEELMTILGWK